MLNPHIFRAYDVRGKVGDDVNPDVFRQVGRAYATLIRRNGGFVQYPAAMEAARWLSDMPAGDPRVGDALARMTPQPLRPWLDRIDSTRFGAMRTPRTYIRCLEDRAVAPAKAAEYAARLGVTPIDMTCAHNPMMSALEDLAKILETIAVNGRGA